MSTMQKPNRTCKTSFTSKEFQEHYMMMDMAYRVAQRSTDTHRKVGCLVLKNNNIVAMGWNGTPSGYHTNECKDENERTRPEVVHAEMNAIAKAARSPVSIEGGTMYSTTIPCVECAKLIIQSGIKTVYYVEGYNKCQRGEALLIACGVELIKLVG